MIQNNKILIASLVVVIVVLVLAVFLVDKGVLTNLFKPQPTPTPTKAAPSGPPPTPTPIDGTSILYTGIRFTPQTLEVRVGQFVNIANLGDGPIEISTNDTTSEGRKLNLGRLEVGDTSQFVQFTSPGEYGYYNKLKPEETGKIVVK